MLASPLATREFQVSCQRYIIRLSHAAYQYVRRSPDALRYVGAMCPATSSTMQKSFSASCSPVLAPACSSTPAYVSGGDLFPDYAYFSSYSDSQSVAHAKRYAEVMIERLDLTLTASSPRSPATTAACFGAFQLGPRAVLGGGARGDMAPAGAPGYPDGGPVPRHGSASRLPRRGRADLVAANDVFAHVPDIRGFAARPTGAGRTAAWSRWTSRTCCA